MTRPPEWAAELQAGDRLGRYLIRRQLGAGASATVYEAVLEPIDRVVALKVLHAQLTTDPMFVRRFSDEAKAVARLDHPSIVHVYDFDRIDASHVIAMQYVPGGSLGDHFGSVNRLGLEILVEYVAQLAQALEHAHERGVLHRDVKPSNILLGAGRVLLADFGVARLVDSPGVTRINLGVGTPEYMSPEQCMGRELGPPSDVYSLVVVTYQLLTGRLPFGPSPAMALMHSHVYEQPPSMRAHVPAIAPALDECVLAGLSKDPRDRPTAGAFAEALSRAVGRPASGSGGATRVNWPTVPDIQFHSAPSGAPSRNRNGRRRALSLLGLAAVIALGLGAMRLLPLLSSPEKAPSATREQAVAAAVAWVNEWNRALSSAAPSRPLRVPIESYMSLETAARSSRLELPPRLGPALRQLAASGDSVAGTSISDRKRYLTLKQFWQHAADVNTEIQRLRDSLPSIPAPLTLPLFEMPVLLGASEVIVPLSEFPIGGYRIAADSAHGEGWRRIFEPNVRGSELYFWVAVDVIVEPPFLEARTQIRDDCKWNGPGTAPQSSTEISAPSVGDGGRFCRHTFASGGRVYVYFVASRNVSVLVQNNPTSGIPESAALDQLVALARTQVQILERVAPR